MTKNKLKKLCFGALSAIFICNLNVSNTYASSEKESRMPAKNYNDGYYYSHSVSDNIANNKNWMAFIDSNKKISELSVPGTHDTMANYELTHMVRTQAMSLRGQLDSGIRFLDIRCNYDGNQFKINHGPIGLKYNFDDVLGTVSSFLEDNPTEAVFMRVKQENSKYSDSEFHEKLKEYENKYSKYFWQNYDNYTNNPKLGDVRGKIVVFNDVFGSSVGLDYRSTDKQDNYNIDTNWSLYYKWEDIKNHLDKARNGDMNKIYINYLSASGGSFPYFVASGQSSPEMSAPRLATGLVGPAFNGWYPDFPRGPLNDILFEGTNILTTSNINNNQGRVGIIVSDFPGSGLINSIISKNDFGTSQYISVGGVNYDGDRRVEGLRINIDYNNNYLYLTNRINEPIHAGFNDEFFELKLLDKNRNEKESIKLNGIDTPSDYKFDYINFTKFDIGDILQVSHKEPFRLNVNGKTQELETELYEITDNGLKNLGLPINNSSIKISGSGGGSFELILNNNKISLANRIGGSFGTRNFIGSGHYIEIDIFSKDYLIKGTSRLYWDMYPVSIELNKLQNINYEYGDIIRIRHKEPQYIDINAPILGEKLTGNFQEYTITELGLKPKN